MRNPARRYRSRSPGIENTGTTPVGFLEMFKSSYFADLSLDQWMALTPPELVEAHLKLDCQVMAALRKSKAPVVPASQKHRRTVMTPVNWARLSSSDKPEFSFLNIRLMAQRP
jgi:hypothetical protein